MYTNLTRKIFMKKIIIFLIYVIVHMIICIFIFSILSTVEMLPSINQKQTFLK